MYKKQNTVILSLYLFVLCQMVFALFSTDDSALFSAVAYGVSMAVPIIFLSACEKPIKKQSYRLPKKPFWCTVFTLCVIYIGNLISFALSELFARFGYGISADFPVYSDDVSMIISFIHLVILPPLLEETLMRKYILGMMMPYGKSGAVLFSAIVFALFHANLMQIPFALLCGGVFGYFTVKTGSIAFAVLMHFLNNLSAFAASYLGILTPAQFLLCGLFIVPIGVICGVILYKNGYFREKLTPVKVSFAVMAYAAVCLSLAILAVKPL